MDPKLKLKSSKPVTTIPVPEKFASITVSSSPAPETTRFLPLTTKFSWKVPPDTKILSPLSARFNAA